MIWPELKLILIQLFDGDLDSLSEEAIEAALNIGCEVYEMQMEGYRELELGLKKQSENFIDSHNMYIKYAANELLNMIGSD